MQDGTLSAEVLSLQSLKAELEELKKESMYQVGDVIEVGSISLTGYITGGTTNGVFFIPLAKPVSPEVKSVIVSGSFRFRQNGKYISDSTTTYGFNTGNGTDSTDYFNALGVGITVKMAGGVAFPNMTNNDCVSAQFYSLKIEFK